MALFITLPFRAVAAVFKARAVVRSGQRTRRVKVVNQPGVVPTRLRFTTSRPVYVPARPDLP